MKQAYLALISFLSITPIHILLRAVVRTLDNGLKAGASMEKVPLSERGEQQPPPQHAVYSLSHGRFVLFLGHRLQEGENIAVGAMQTCK